VNYKIALNFEDGVTRFVTCLPGDTVADAAYRFGVNIPLDCREGACGTCKAICESGSVNMTDYVDEALSVEEAAAGYVLTCKARPTSDCVIRIPSSSSACKAVDNTVRKASISRLEQLSPSTIHLELAGPEIEKLHFLPGQYANLFVPGSEASRAYSFSSLARGGKVGFLIRNVPNGMMSGFLTGAAKEGDALRYQAPFGGFYLRKVERPVLMIAGGTGLAPFWPCWNRWTKIRCSSRFACYTAFPGTRTWSPWKNSIISRNRSPILTTRPVSRIRRWRAVSVASSPTI